MAISDGERELLAAQEILRSAGLPNDRDTVADSLDYVRCWKCGTRKAFNDFCPACNPPIGDDDGDAR